MSHSLDVTNPLIKRLLIEHVLELIDNGYTEKLIALGFSHSLLDDLRNRPTADFIKLASQLPIKINLCAHSLGRSLKLLDMRNETEPMRNYFIRNGASRRMVCTYFKMSLDDYRRLRNQLCPDAAVGGRVAMPPVAVRDAIHADWHAIQKSCPHDALRQRIFNLHQKHPQKSIGSLQNTLIEFCEKKEKNDALELNDFNNG